MKVAITGKGGVGKTTFASTLCRLYAEEGRTVLAADVDPDANLGLALGFSEEEVNAIVPISKMRKLVEERTGANAANKFFKLNPQVSDIPDTYAKEINGVKLLDGSLSGRHDGSGAGSKDGLSSTGALKVHFGTANDSAEDYYYVEIGNCTLAGLGLREGAAEPVARNADAAVAPLQQLTGEHKYADIGFGPDFSELKTNENIKTLVLANVTLTTLCKELHDDGDLITYLINLDAARVMLQELCSLLRNYTIVDPSDPV